MNEHQQVEWKTIWRDEYLRWICGFANAEGGTLWIGKDDRGNLVGLRNSAKLLEDLPNKIRDVLGILVEVNLHEDGDRTCIAITVPGYPSPISCRGHYYQRVGSTNQELKGTALDHFLLRRQGRTWDSVPVPGVRVEDLSREALQRFRALAQGGGRVDATMLREPDAGLIDKLKLTEGTYLKRAAVLLFHDDPERFVTGAFVKIGFFRSETDLVYHDEVHGDLFEQAEKTLDLLRTKYLKASIRYEGVQRIERFPVPDAALREALLNALVHRDYAVPAPVQIHVYDNRLKIWNPAVLPEGWNLEKLLGEHASHPYNPKVANAFFRAGEIEAWGRGIRKIFEACSAGGAPQPDIRLDGHDLWVEFPFAPEYLQLLRATKAQTDEPGLAEKTRVETPMKTPMKTSEKTSEKASEKTSEKIIAEIRKNALVTIAELSQLTGVTTRSVERNIRKLQAAGALRRIGPDKGGYWEVLT